MTAEMADQEQFLFYSRTKMTPAPPIQLPRVGIDWPLLHDVMVAQIESAFCRRPGVRMVP